MKSHDLLTLVLCAAACLELPELPKRSGNDSGPTSDLSLARDGGLPPVDSANELPDTAPLSDAGADAATAPPTGVHRPLPSGTDAAHCIEMG